MSLKIILHLIYIKMIWLRKILRLEEGCLTGGKRMETAVDLYDRLAVSQFLANQPVGKNQQIDAAPPFQPAGVIRFAA